MNTTIMGLGLYGLSVANSLTKNMNNSLKIWAESDDAIKNVENKLNMLGLEDIYGVEYTSSYKEALKDAELILIMCSEMYVRSICENMLPYINDNMDYVIGSKGIEQTSCKFGHQIFDEIIKTENIAVMSGGSFAVDIAHGDPVGLAFGSKSKRTIEKAKYVFDNTNIKIRPSDDLMGIAVCGAIKNVIAIAAGMLEGMGYSESTRCFLITESIHDIKELIKKLDGDKSTILSYAGVGDLLLTATSTKSRNYTYGLLLGQGKFTEAEEYLKNTTVEGCYSLLSFYRLMEQEHIDIPIVKLLYNIMQHKREPETLTRFLIKKR